jgi:hypothetical protein
MRPQEWPHYNSYLLWEGGSFRWSWTGLKRESGPQAVLASDLLEVPDDVVEAGLVWTALPGGVPIVRRQMLVMVVLLHDVKKPTARGCKMRREDVESLP